MRLSWREATITTKHQHSYAIGARALEALKRYDLPADPRNYELFYWHTSAGIPALTRAIDEKLSQGQALTPDDVARLHEKYLPRFDTERVAELGSELRDETEQIIGMIEAAVGVAVGFDESLTETDRRLATTNIDRDTLRGIIEAVVLATRDMQQENAKLGKNLNQSKQNISQLQESLIAVRMESLTDALTGLANRRHFDAALIDVISAAEAAREPVSLLMADVDHFKRFNDAHGHQLGDQVLRLMATALKQCVKGQDIVARYGGEEFAIILPNTELDEAIAVANNIRVAVAAHEVVKRSTGERLGRMSLSVGVAQHRAGMTAQELIEWADASLYRAKANGRDQVVADAGAAH